MTVVVPETSEDTELDRVCEVNIGRTVMIAGFKLFTLSDLTCDKAATHWVHLFCDKEGPYRLAMCWKHVKMLKRKDRQNRLLCTRDDSTMRIVLVEQIGRKER